MTKILPLLLAISLAMPASAADSAPKKKPKAKPAAAATPVTPPPALTLEDLGVKESKLDPQLQAEIATRNSRLALHQKMGIVTWGLMTGAFLLSERGKDTNTRIHQIAGGVAAASYFTTGYLSMFAPDPQHVSGTSGTNIRIHKILRWVHLPLMVLMPIAGLQATHQNDRHQDLHGLAKYKGAIGTTAYISYTLAGAVMFFEF